MRQKKLVVGENGQGKRQKKGGKSYLYKLAQLEKSLKHKGTFFHLPVFS